MRYILRATWLRSAVLLVAVFGLLHLLGWRDSMSIISGTPSADGQARTAMRGVCYGMMYFGAVILAPILIIATGLRWVICRLGAGIEGKDDAQGGANSKMA